MNKKVLLFIFLLFVFIIPKVKAIDTILPVFEDYDMYVTNKKGLELVGGTPISYEGGTGTNYNQYAYVEGDNTDDVYGLEVLYAFEHLKFYNATIKEISFQTYNETTNIEFNKYQIKIENFNQTSESWYESYVSSEYSFSYGVASYRSTTITINSMTYFPIWRLRVYVSSGVDTAVNYGWCELKFIRLTYTIEFSETNSDVADLGFILGIVALLISVCALGISLKRL